MAKLEKIIEITFDQLQEIILLLKNVSDYDLSGYTQSSLKRRVERVLNLKQMDIVDLKNALVNTPGFQQYFAEEITVNVTEMFRDPEFFNRLTTDVIP